MEIFSLKGCRAGIVLLLSGTLLLTMCQSKDRAERRQKSREQTMLSRIHALELDSIRQGMVVYFPEGYRERAETLGPMYAEAIRFLNDSLRVELELHLALLDTINWKRLKSIPYGLPFVEGMNNQDPSVACLPAEGGGAVYEFVAGLESDLPASVRERLTVTGYTWEQASRRMVDLIGFHELGHAYATLFGIEAPAIWFDEFLASYVAFLYMHQQRPEMAEIWEITGGGILRGYEPEHRTLAEFERLYSRVGVPDYAWYQSAFEERVNPLVKRHGFALLRKSKELFPSGTETLPPHKVLARLEEHYPGFQAWAELFQ